MVLYPDSDFSPSGKSLRSTLIFGVIEDEQIESNGESDFAKFNNKPSGCSFSLYDVSAKDKNSKKISVKQVIIFL